MICLWEIKIEVYEKYSVHDYHCIDISLYVLFDIFCANFDHNNYGLQYLIIITQSIIELIEGYHFV